MKTPPLGMTHDNFCAIVDPRSPNPKTETRRLLTLKGRTQEEVNEIQAFYQDGDNNWIGAFGTMPRDPEWVKKAYPKGSNQGIKSRLQVGDRAYLKEPTQVIKCDQHPKTKQWTALVQYFWHSETSFWVDITEDDVDALNKRKTGFDSKQNAMFMLKSFARYWVEITDVRVERLLDITEEAAIAEGIETINLSCNPVYRNYTKEGEYIADPIQSYLSEIEMLHGKAIAQSNPWLWVYKFKFLGDHNG